MIIPVWGFVRKSWPVVHLTGDDRIDFLQRISSQNFKSLSPNSVVPSAFLNGNGSVIGLFMAHVKSDRVTLYMEPQSQSRILQHIDKLHFTEKIEVQSEHKDFIEIRGPQVRDFLKKNYHLEVDAKKTWPREALSQNILPAEPWNGLGFLVEGAGPSELKMLSEAEYYAIRAENLFPRDQIDIGDGNIILESGLTDYVHRNKGCYPGQEVIERIYTYGNVAKKMILLEGHARELEKGNELFSSEKSVGHVTSRHTLQGAGQSASYYYVATVFRMSAQIGNIFSLGAGQPAQLKVVKVAASTEG